MRILITGATGGLGRNLTPYLIKLGHEVTTLGRNELIGQELVKQGARFHSSEITNRKILEDSINGQDAIIHAAGLASPWGKWEDFYRINTEGTKLVTDLGSEYGIKRLIHLSTPSMYYDGKDRENIKESDPLPEPATHYARSKILADQIVTKAVEENNLSAIMLRPRAIFGPHDTAIFPRLLRIMQKGFFPLPNGGLARTNITYVDNVLSAVNLALHASNEFSGKAYNITNDESLTIKELATTLVEKLNLKVKFVNVPLPVVKAAANTLEFVADHITHREPPLTNYSIGLLGVSQTLNIDAAKKDLGYSPEITIREGIDKYLNWRKGTNQSQHL